MELDTGTTPPTSKCIRFYEYASVIPCPDSDGPPSASSDRAHSPLAGSPPGRPRLGSRTYSVPIPSSFSSFSSFFGPSYGYCPTSPSSASSNHHIARDLADDPTFFPNPPPKLNVRIPTFTRKRRNTTSGVPSHGLKSCMKSEKGTPKSQAAPLPRKFNKARADPVYCPALAKVLRAAAAADDCLKSPPESDQQQLPVNSPPKSTSSSLSSSPPVLSSSPGSAGSYFGSFMSPLKRQRSNTSNTNTSATAPASGTAATASTASLGTSSTSSTAGHEDDQVDLLPIRECCRACHRATRYGETSDDATYFEKFSKSALEKRKRDEETKYERGEYVVRRSHTAPTPAEERERYREEIKKRNIVERSPDGSAQPLPVRSKSLSACGAMAQRIQEKNEDCPELEREPEKKKQCLDELDMGRKKATETKLRDKGDGAEISSGESSSSNSEEESEANSHNIDDHHDEGEGLQLEGVPDLASGQTDAHRRDRRASDQTIRPNKDEALEEKNPICTLGASGELVPARSAVDSSVHRHHHHHHHSQVDGNAARAPNALPNVAEESSGFQRDGSDDDTASTDSSDMHDDVISSLGFLKGSLGPSAVPQQQQHQQGGHDSPLDEKELANLLSGGLQLDSLASLTLSDNTKKKDQQPKVTKREEEEKPRCSPLIRSKACLRPSLYGAEEAAGASPRAMPAAVAGMALDSSEDENATRDTAPKRREKSSPPVVLQSQKERDAELLEALKAADKPLYFPKKRGAASSGESMNGGVVHRSAGDEARAQPLEGDKVDSMAPSSNKNGNAPAANNASSGNGRGWASRIFHPAKSLSSLGAAHGIVH